MKKYGNFDRVWVLEEGDTVLPDRTHVTNKGDCGKILAVGGDRGMAGAVAFCAESAYRSGAGLVYVHTHPENRIPVQILVPEAVCSFWGESKAEPNKYSAVAVGIGMGKSDGARKLLYSLLLRTRVPTVIDADALNIISETPELFELLGRHTVLTPHVMELSRLTGKSVDEIKSDTISSAVDFSRKYNTNLVLKDKNTVIALADGSVYVNMTGDSTLSKGGSGDILTGVIASFLGQNMPIEKAVPTAVYLHGRAGERAGKALGQRSALARDVISALAQVIKDM